MQHTHLTQAQRAAYHEHLQSDHDFLVWADILTMEEKPVGEAPLLDGQVNIDTTVGSDPHRTATLTLSDPEQVLSFGTRLAEDPDGVLWVNRLVRVQHYVEVPGVGPVTSVPFLGTPTSAGRNGAEVGLELADKSRLAHHGVGERTFAKGTSARAAIYFCLYNLTGEWRIALPASTKKLSRAYSVGMAEDAYTPWSLARLIAWNELRWNLEYTADGVARALPSTATMGEITMDHVTALPAQQTAFTDFKNYARVTSKRQAVKKTTAATVTTTSVYTGVARLPASNRLSAEGLARHGVGRLLPLAIQDDALKNATAVSTRAASELRAVDAVDAEQSYAVIPVFHLDNRDIIRMPYGIGAVALTVGSIPLMTGGDMSVGQKKWVSAPLTVRATVRTRRSVKRVVKKKKAAPKRRKRRRRK